MFNLSIRENITLFREVPSTLLSFAIDAVALKDLIDRLPEGIDTVIGERGYQLSG